MATISNGYQVESAPVMDDGPAVPDVPTGGNLLETLKKDYERLRQQKARQTGGVEGSTLLNLSFLDDEHYTDYKNRGGRDC
jgi:hypothetical protein